MFTPDRTLAVGTTYRFRTTHVRDLAGNPNPHGTNTSFTTGFGSDTTGPSVTETSLPPGSTNVTPFPEFVFTFDERVDPRTVGPSTVRLLDGGAALPVHAAIVESPYPADLAWKRVEARCLCALQLARNYTIEISGVKDLSGNPMASTYRYSFTTRGAYDFDPPRLTFNLRSVGDLFRGVAARIRSNEPLNPATVTSDNVYYLYQGQALPGTASLDASGTLIRITPSQLLPANAEIGIWVLPAVEDRNGNAVQRQEGTSFQTGEAEADTEPPVVSAVHPPDGATNVPVNVKPTVRYSEPFDPFEGYPQFRVLGPGGVEADTDAPLQPSTTYTIDISAEGADFAGLPFAGAQFSFTTASSTAVDLTPPNLLSAAPASQGVDVPLNVEL